MLAFQQIFAHKNGLFTWFHLNCTEVQYFWTEKTEGSEAITPIAPRTSTRVTDTEGAAGRGGGPEPDVLK